MRASLATLVRPVVAARCLYVHVLQGLHNRYHGNMCGVYGMAYGNWQWGCLSGLDARLIDDGLGIIVLDMGSVWLLLALSREDEGRNNGDKTE